MEKITKCIIPAAGLGTRFLPATKAQPKEMLPIVDKPVIQYLVEEAVGAGITDILIITGKGKRSIEDHFDESFELSYSLREKGKLRDLEEVERISRLANIAYIRQPTPRGDGDAILRARHFIGDDAFLILFGDDLIKGPENAATQLIEAYYRKNSPIIALERVPDHMVHQYGIIESKASDDGIHLVEKFLEKPKATETASRLGVIGKYVVTADIFDHLFAIHPEKNQEIRLADAFSRIITSRDIYGLEIRGTRYDTGSKIGFLKATVDFALERGDIGEEFREFLKTK